MELSTGVVNLLWLRLVKVIFVKDECVGEYVTEDTGECGFAAGGRTGHAYYERFDHLSSIFLGGVIGGSEV